VLAVADAQELKPPMQMPGHYDPQTRRCVTDPHYTPGPNVAEHYVDADGDKLVSKTEFARWFWRRQGRCPNNEEWTAFQRADVDRSGTIDIQEFENFVKAKFGPKAIPRHSEQEKSVEDSLDEFTDVRLSLFERAFQRQNSFPTAAPRVCSWKQPLQPTLPATVFLPLDCSRALTDVQADPPVAAEQVQEAADVLASRRLGHTILQQRDRQAEMLAETAPAAAAVR